MKNVAHQQTPSASAFPFTEQQQSCINSTFQILSTCGIALISGAAGSGKSSILKELWQSTNGHVTSFTNKVCNDLNHKIRGCNAQTLHKLLDLQIVSSASNAQRWGKPKTRMFTKPVFVDECSYVNDEMYQWLVDRALAGICFIGDSAQLPPVGYPQAKPFEVIKPPFRFDLTQVHRQQEASALLRFLTDLRALIQELADRGIGQATGPQGRYLTQAYESWGDFAKEKDGSINLALSWNYVRDALIKHIHDGRAFNQSIAFLSYTNHRADQMRDEVSTITGKHSKSLESFITSIHKAQGCQWANVVLDISSLDCVRDAAGDNRELQQLKLLFVGASRAVHKLFALK